jgi:hypothetical protein
MTTSTLVKPDRDADIAIDLVPEAWARACRVTGLSVTQPSAIIPLKPQKSDRKSGTYRLEGVDLPVVAKRCSRANAHIERTIYQQVLPATGLPTLAVFACVDDATDPKCCWLFVEDAGPANVTERDRALVASWLARLHRSSPALTDTISLPERGPAHYLEQLRSARRNLQQGIETGDLTVAECATLEQLLPLLNQIEERWKAICVACNIVPRTLVHGDLARKNCRLRGACEVPSVVMLDWETAGWGPPAADLADWARPPKKTPDGWGGTVPLDVYALAVADAWPAVTWRDLQEQARIGTMFRLIAATLWASELLEVGGGARAVGKLAWIYDKLAATEAAFN